MSGEHGAACFTNLKLYLVKIKTEQNINHVVARKMKNEESLKIF